MTNKNRKTIRGKNGFKIAIFALPVLIIVIIGVLIFNGRINGASSSAGVVKDSDLVIKIDEVTDKAGFYPVEIEGTRLEVMAVRASDGTIRTAFNTCQVCYSSGRGYYRQEGDELVCQNCGNRFGTDEVEVIRGGCNPFPITDDFKTVDDETIVISKDFLNQARVIFSDWKK